MSTIDTIGPTDRSQLTNARAEKTQTGRHWPRSREAMEVEVKRRRDAYLGLAYSERDIRDMALFKALDSNNRISATTSRVLRDIAFVANVDAASIASDCLRLSIEDEAPDRETLHATAKRVWDGSQIDARRHWWARTLCVDGELLLEAIQTSDGPRVIMHPFETYRLTYDRTGTRIERAVITRQLPPDDVVGADGTLEAGTDEREYRRVITPTTVQAWIDSVPIAEETGANPLGVVPVVRATFMPVLDGAFCLNAAYGYDDAIAALDSLVCQFRTIATRHANPLLVGLGVDVGTGASLQEQGRAVALPADTDLKWLEATLSGIDSMVKTMEQIRVSIVQTLPEFMFTESSATASGTALSYRASAFVAFIGPIRESFYNALELVMSYALAIGSGSAWTHESNVVEVEGGPAIPQDVAMLAQVYTGLRDAGAITGEDLARYLQGAGIASDDVSPAEYAAKALAEHAARAGDTGAKIQQLQDLLAAIRESEPIAGVGAELVAPADGPPPAEPLAPPDNMTPTA